MDYFEIFQNLLAEQKSRQNLEDDLRQIFASLQMELRINKNTIADLQNQLQDLLSSDTFSITAKYTALKERHQELEKKYTDLKNNNDDLQIQLFTNEQELKQRFAEEKQQIEHDFSQRLQQKDQELTATKLLHDNKQQQIYNEMHATEAKFVMQSEQVKQELKRQLNETTQRLRDVTDTSNVLRNELRIVKEQFMEHKRTAKQRITELQQMLKQQHQAGTNRTKTSSDPYALPKRYESFDDTDDFVDVSDEDNNNKSMNFPPPDKSPPLNVTLAEDQAGGFTNVPNRPPVYRKAPFYRGSSHFRGPASNQSTPRLNANSSKVNPPNSNRKRKLYNPDNLDYLTDLN